MQGTPNSLNREIPLTQGKVARVSPEDYERLSSYKWHVGVGGYASRNRRKSDGPGSAFIRMHHEVLPTVEGKCTDHIDGDIYNNTRGNLRLASVKENVRNAKVSAKNKSGFKGVSWHEWTKRWRATILVDRKQIFLGHFHDPAEAAKAYDRAAREHFGRFAKLNFGDT